MPASFSLPPARRSWSGDDVRILRELARQDLPIPVIAKLLCRSESAIRNKAAMHGVPVRSAPRACGAPGQETGTMG